MIKFDYIDKQRKVSGADICCDCKEYKPYFRSINEMQLFIQNNLGKFNYDVESGLSNKRIKSKDNLSNTWKVLVINRYHTITRLQYISNTSLYHNIHFMEFIKLFIENLKHQ